MEKRVFIKIYLVKSIISMPGVVILIPNVVAFVPGVIAFVSGVIAFVSGVFTLVLGIVGASLATNILMVGGSELVESRCHERGMPIGLMVSSSQDLPSMSLTWSWIFIPKFPHLSLPRISPSV